MMKVKELIDLLSKCNPDFEVVMSKDGEGNNFSPLVDVNANEMYEADSTWSGEIIDKEEMQDDNYKPNAIVLWPTN